jgi:hypothetical protein
MRAILWKEFREALPVAAGLAAVVACVLGWLVWQGTRWTSEMGCEPLLIGLQVVSALFAAAAGLTLGLRQSFPETRGGLWAFWVHRPVPRRTLFLGRVLVGLGFYAAALVVPFAAAFVWLRQPGHLAAPFYYSMAGPHAVDLLTGTVWYFAGLLAGGRSARWYGSRVLPVATAALCSVAVVQVPRAWQAVAISIVAGPALAAAAYGAFVAGGELRSRPRLARAGLGVALAAAILFVVAVAVGLLSGLLADPQAPEVQYAFGRDGDVLRIEKEPGGHVSAVIDLSGKTHFDPRSPEAIKLLASDQVISVSLAPGTRAEAGYRIAWRRVSHMSRTDDGINWDYSAVEGLIVAHDTRTRRRVGTLGPDGFVPADRGAARPFRDEYLWDATSPEYIVIIDNQTHRNRLLFFRRSVYDVSLHDRRARAVFNGSADEPVLGGALTWVRRDETHVQMQVIATRRYVHVSIPAEEPRIAVPLDQDPARYGTVVVLYQPESEPNVFIRYEPSDRKGGAARTPYIVVKADKGGRIVDRRTLPPLPAEERPNASQSAVAGLFSPPLVYALVSAYDWRAGKDVSDPWAAAGPSAVVWLVFLALGVLGSAAANFILARRSAVPASRQIGWGLIGLLLGATGFLLMLCMQGWPARVRCPECGRMRPVDRGGCPRCGRPFPPPAADGTEIFEPAM